MSIYKIPLQENVLDASAERIDWTLNNFSRVCVSFSGGKDSTVMLHLVAQKARQLKRKIDVIFLDWEAQFSSTIQHVDTMRTLYRDVIHQFWWVALHSFNLNGSAGNPGQTGFASHRKMPLPITTISIFISRE